MSHQQSGSYNDRLSGWKEKMEELDPSDKDNDSFLFNTETHDKPTHYWNTREELNVKGITKFLIKL